MDLYRVLGSAIADSVAVVGDACRRLAVSDSDSAHVDAAAGWASQFSEASLDDRRGRRRVEALFRGATVRI